MQLLCCSPFLFISHSFVFSHLISSPRLFLWFLFSHSLPLSTEFCLGLYLPLFSPPLSPSLSLCPPADCKRQEILQHVAVNDSSWQRAAGAGAGAGDGQPADWSPNDTDPASPSVLWTPDHGGHTSQPWLQLDLGEKKRITG